MLRFFGVPGVDIGGTRHGVGGEIATVVLACLGANPNRAVSVQRLAEAVWRDEPPRTAASSLRAHVARLRRRITMAVPTAEIRSQPIPGASTAYVLVVGDEAVDHLAFGRFLADAQARLRRGETEAARSAVETALGLFRGDPFDEVDVPWLEPIRRQLEGQRIDAYELLAETALAQRDYAYVASELGPVAWEHPHRERLCGHVMRALYRAGRQSEALDMFQQTRRWLVENLGIEPTTDLVRLERDILNHANVDADPLGWYQPHPKSAPVPASQWTRAPMTYRRPGAVDPRAELVVDLLVGLGRATQHLGDHASAIKSLTGAMERLGAPSLTDNVLDVALAAAEIGEMLRNANPVPEPRYTADAAAAGDGRCCVAVAAARQAVRASTSNDAQGRK